MKKILGETHQIESHHSKEKKIMAGIIKIIEILEVMMPGEAKIMKEVDTGVIVEGSEEMVETLEETEMVIEVEEEVIEVILTEKEVALEVIEGISEGKEEVLEVTEEVMDRSHSMKSKIETLLKKNPGVIIEVLKMKIKIGAQVTMTSRSLLPQMVGVKLQERIMMIILLVGQNHLPLISLKNPIN